MPSWFTYIDLYCLTYDSKGQKRVQFKVDTGANISSISLNALLALGYTADWIVQNGTLEPAAETANGRTVENCYRIHLPQVKFGVYTCKNPLFLTSLTEDMRNLFGLNFMRYFNWDLNYQTKVAEYFINENQFTLGDSVFEVHDLAV